MQVAIINSVHHRLLYKTMTSEYRFLLSEGTIKCNKNLQYSVINKHLHSCDNCLVFVSFLLLLPNSNSTPLFSVKLKVKYSSCIIGKLDSILSEHSGHLSLGNRVLSKYVAHQ